MAGTNRLLNLFILHPILRVNFLRAYNTYEDYLVYQKFQILAIAGCFDTMPGISDLM